LKSDQQLRKTIDDLRELERKCFASRRRFAFYSYLAAVFELYVQLRRTNQAKPAAQRIAKLHGLRNQKCRHPIRTIIDATSTTDIKTRSRWSRALRYAWRERKTWKGLGSFLRENGGPAGCADQFAATNQRGRYPGSLPPPRNWSALSNSPQRRLNRVSSPAPQLEAQCGFLSHFANA
jgi:hypothetical protein